MDGTHFDFSLPTTFFFFFLEEFRIADRHPFLRLIMNVALFAKARRAEIEALVPLIEERLNNRHRSVRRPSSANNHISEMATETSHVKRQSSAVQALVEQKRDRMWRKRMSGSMKKRRKQRRQLQAVSAVPETQGTAGQRSSTAGPAPAQSSFNSLPGHWLPSHNYVNRRFQMVELNCSSVDGEDHMKRTLIPFHSTRKQFKRLLHEVNSNVVLSDLSYFDTEWFEIPLRAAGPAKGERNPRQQQQPVGDGTGRTSSASLLEAQLDDLRRRFLRSWNNTGSETMSSSDTTTFQWTLSSEKNYRLRFCLPLQVQSAGSLEEDESKSGGENLLTGFPFGDGPLSFHVDAREERESDALPRTSSRVPTTSSSSSVLVWFECVVKPLPATGNLSVLIVGPPGSFAAVGLTGATKSGNSLLRSFQQLLELEPSPKETNLVRGPVLLLELMGANAFQSIGGLMKLISSEPWTKGSASSVERYLITSTSTPLPQVWVAIQFEAKHSATASVRKVKPFSKHAQSFIHQFLDLLRGLGKELKEPSSNRKRERNEESDPIQGTAGSEPMHMSVFGAGLIGLEERRFLRAQFGLPTWDYRILKTSRTTGKKSTAAPAQLCVPSFEGEGYPMPLYFSNGNVPGSPSATASTPTENLYRVYLYLGEDSANPLTDESVDNLKALAESFEVYSQKWRRVEEPSERSEVVTVTAEVRKNSPDVAEDDFVGEMFSLDDDDLPDQSDLKPDSDRPPDDDQPDKWILVGSGQPAGYCQRLGCGVGRSWIGLQLMPLLLTGAVRTPDCATEGAMTWTGLRTVRCWVTLANQVGTGASAFRNSKPLKGVPAVLGVHMSLSEVLSFF